MPDPWDSKTVIGLFCDPYVANTNLEGGHSEETLSDVSGWLKDLKSSNPKASKVLQEASHLFAEGARLGNEGRGAFGSATGAAAWCQSLRKALEGLKQGDMLLAPGGWIHNKGGHAILYLFQRVRGNEFSFAVCNTGEGVNAHPQDAGAAVFPKEKHVTSWRLTGIPAEKVLDELWLHALFKIYFTKADHHKPPMLYEVLLPMLLPNGDVRKQTDESWQTAATLQRAGSCYYKCIPAALRLILGTRGIEAPERKRLMYQLRVQQLQQIHRALGNTDLEGLSRSDLMVVECACRQVAQKVLREERVGLPAKDMESVRELIAAVDAKVGEAHQAQREAMAARAVGISEGANPANVGYVGFPGWEALSVAWAGKGNSNYRAYSHLMGPKDSQNLGEHVDLASLRQLSGIELLRTVRTMCPTPIAGLGFRI
ncbi:unnamed protein product [Symbiodinium natans]|uniref:Uncharacterized protein n=1 Tax=Symbiodinium natans TaxID=878477 RepID=A0A812M094_9DINO|nr:unnamed protein product [Symbiodinium natans]